MGRHYFVSYSRAEAAEFARRLADRLVAGPPSYPVWLDVRDVQPGGDWDKQIRDAIQDSQGLLFVMTKDSVRDYSLTEEEWGWALKCKKPIIPLRVDSDAKLPFRLSSRQYIDFTDSFDIGLAKLRDHFDRLGTPQGVLQVLRLRMADAERELPRAKDEAQRARIDQDIRDLRQRITAQEKLVADPGAAAAQTSQRIVTELEGQREPERPKPKTVARAKFVNAAPMIAPSYFQDRHVETELLVEFLRGDDARLVTVVGRGGVGKTAMVCRLLKALESGRLPDDLGEFAVDGIVYLSTPSAHPVNFPNLFTDLCRLLAPETAERLLQRYRDPHQTPTGLMLALLDAFPAGRSVVLLDNFEDLVDVGTTMITDSALDEALRALLSAPAHGVKVILTTRVAPQPLLLHQPEVQQRINLDEGLPSPYAEKLLRARDPHGTLGLKTAPEAQLSLARERTRGYPRALEALAAILSADRNTTLPDLLAQTAQLPENVVEALVGQAFHRLDPLAQQIMQALAIYPVPVPAVALDYLLQPYQPTIDSAPVLARLVNMQFVRRDAGRYYLHQVDRDYALSRIPTGHSDNSDTDPQPFTRHTLRSRGADYFTHVQTPREEWKTLDDLAPQLAEFELRYQNETYDAAAVVLLGIDYDCLMQWGHYRLTIELHTRLQDHITDPFTITPSKNNLAEAHRTLGEYPKAIRLQEQALAIHQETGNRFGEGVSLGNLANCYYELGQTLRAIELYEKSRTIAQEVGNRKSEANQLGNLGNCYGDLGQIPRAIDLYEQALGIARDIGDQAEESSDLGRLASSYADLGEMPQAIELFKQALELDRDIGYRYGEAIDLSNLGGVYAKLSQLERAIGCLRQALEVADAIGSAQAQAETRLALALTHLYAGDVSSARQVIEAARDYPYPAAEARFALVSGIVHLRQGATNTAAEAFRNAIANADRQLHQTSNDVDALDTKATALAGLSLTGPTDHSADAIAAFQAARNLTTAAGIVTGVLQRLDVLTPADPSGVLYNIRRAAAGLER